MIHTSQIAQQFKTKSIYIHLYETLYYLFALKICCFGGVFSQSDTPPPISSHTDGCQLKMRWWF